MSCTFHFDVAWKGTQQQYDVKSHFGELRDYNYQQLSTLSTSELKELAIKMVALMNPGKLETPEVVERGKLERVIWEKPNSFPKKLGVRAM